MFVSGGGFVVSKKERNKGYRGEHLFVKMCREVGIEAHRLSPPGGDVVLPNRQEVEVKNRKAVAVVNWFEASDCPYLAIKIPGKRDFLVCMSFNLWSKLWKRGL